MIGDGVRLDRVEVVGPKRTLAPATQNRAVIPAKDFAAHSPFILMMEDFIGPAMDFHMHPHRGLETVTLLLDGALEHQDHTGVHGTMQAGDVQWMTAGRGIMHGGRPREGGAHALQLWLNLPAALKMSTPGTRVQLRDEALVEARDGVTARRYGMPSPSMPEAWSLWPITIVDAVLSAGTQYDLKTETDQRQCVYVLDGEVGVGDDRRRLIAGRIGWLDPANGHSDEPRLLTLRASTSSRVVAYAGTPINEPVVARGSFVMNSDEEIRQANADLRAGTFLNSQVVQ